METRPRTATIIKSKKYFIFNEIAFDVSFDSDYSFYSSNEFELIGKEGVIYSHPSTNKYPLYKKKIIKMKSKFLATYPINLLIKHYNVDILEPKYKNSTSATYIVKVGSKELGQLVTSFPMFSFTETYTAYIHTDIHEEIDIMMFVLVFIFMKSNESIGT